MSESFGDRCERFMDGEIGIYIGIGESIENIERFAHAVSEELSDRLRVIAFESEVGDADSIYEYIVSRHYTYDFCIVNNIDGEITIDACRRMYLNQHDIADHTIGWFLRNYSNEFNPACSGFENVF